MTLVTPAHSVGAPKRVRFKEEPEDDRPAREEAGGVPSPPPHTSTAGGVSSSPKAEAKKEEEEVVAEEEDEDEDRRLLKRLRDDGDIEALDGGRVKAEIMEGEEEEGAEGRRRGKRRAIGKGIRGGAQSAAAAGTSASASAPRTAAKPEDNEFDAAEEDSDVSQRERKLPPSDELVTLHQHAVTLHFSCNSTLQSI